MSSTAYTTVAVPQTGSQTAGVLALDSTSFTVKAPAGVNVQVTLSNPGTMLGFLLATLTGGQTQTFTRSAYSSIITTTKTITVIDTATFRYIATANVSPTTSAPSVQGTVSPKVDLPAYPYNMSTIVGVSIQIDTAASAATFTVPDADKTQYAVYLQYWGDTTATLMNLPPNARTQGAWVAPGIRLWVTRLSDRAFVAMADSGPPSPTYSKGANQVSTIAPVSGVVLEVTRTRVKWSSGPYPAVALYLGDPNTNQMTLYSYSASGDATHDFLPGLVFVLFRLDGVALKREAIPAGTGITWTVTPLNTTVEVRKNPTATDPFTGTLIVSRVGGSTLPYAYAPGDTFVLYAVLPNNSRMRLDDVTVPGVSLAPAPTQTPAPFGTYPPNTTEAAATISGTITIS